MIAAALDYARRHRERFVQELQDFVRMPSVSAQARHASDVRRCAGWLTNHLATLGLQAQVTGTSGHPAVVARSRWASDRPTVLVYGHYDVQPPDPIHEWHRHPFGGELVDGAVYGRGASDDKGQVLAHMKAVEAWLRSPTGLPVNVVSVIEGEEEIGSPHLGTILDGIPERPDVAVVSDMPMAGSHRPAITLGMRGTLACEIVVKGPARDLHSGLFGGAVLNPAAALSSLLAGLHDADGRVAVPGFYDRVQARDAAQRARLVRHGPPDAVLARTAAVSSLWGEPGFTGYERTTIRPALTINGLTSGYQGEGVKGIIPARAAAKLSVRLAAGQEPSSIADAIARDLRRRCPRQVTLDIRWQSASRPFEFSAGGGVLRAAERACALGFGRPPALLRSGGTIPILSWFARAGIPPLLIGFARPDDGAHGPNERFHVETFASAIDTSIHLLNELRRTARPRVRASTGTEVYS